MTVEAVQQFLFLVCLVSFVEEDFFPHKPFFFFEVPIKRRRDDDDDDDDDDGVAL